MKKIIKLILTISMLLVTTSASSITFEEAKKLQVCYEDSYGNFQTTRYRLGSLTENLRPTYQTTAVYYRIYGVAYPLEYQENIYAIFKFIKFIDDKEEIQNDTSNKWSKEAEKKFVNKRIAEAKSKSTHMDVSERVLARGLATAEWDRMKAKAEREDAIRNEKKLNDRLLSIKYGDSNVENIKDFIFTLQYRKLYKGACMEVVRYRLQQNDILAKESLTRDSDDFATFESEIRNKFLISY